MFQKFWNAFSMQLMPIRASCLLYMYTFEYQEYIKYTIYFILFYYFLFYFFTYLFIHICCVCPKLSFAWHCKNQDFEQKPTVSQWQIKQLLLLEEGHSARHRSTDPSFKLAKVKRFQTSFGTHGQIVCRSEFKFHKHDAFIILMGFILYTN